MTINFWSNAKEPFQSLSNFIEIIDGIKYDNIYYPSVEHAFQAQKYIKEQRERFSVSGDLGNWDGIRLVFKENECEKKRVYWSKKKNIGIIAKMATNIKVGKKLGLVRDDTFKSSFELWKTLLLLKFSIDYFNNILKSTGDIYLLHFDRGRATSFWGGKIVDNNLAGNNEMGKYLMEVRKILL